MYCESQEKAQSHTHFSEDLSCSVLLELKSAVDQILHVPSAEVVARRLRMNVCVWRVCVCVCVCVCGGGEDVIKDVVESSFTTMSECLRAQQ